jgi:hypothetical protein
MVKQLTVTLALTTLFAIVGAVTASAAPRPQTLSLFERDISQVFSGAAAAPKVGDSFSSIGNYYKWSRSMEGHPFGRLHVKCTIMALTASGGSAQCSATASFPDGAVTVVGPLNLVAQTNRLPIVGGTGKYLGARGYLVTTNIGGQHSNHAADVFHITR